MYYPVICTLSIWSYFNFSYYKCISFFYIYMFVLDFVGKVVYMIILNDIDTEKTNCRAEDNCLLLFLMLLFLAQ